MSNETTIVFGVPVPSVDPFFLVVVRFHILVGVICVVAGIAAMLNAEADRPTTLVDARARHRGDQDLRKSVHLRGLQAPSSTPSRAKALRKRLTNSSHLHSGSEGMGLIRRSSRRSTCP
jgi:hypothetical protein